MHAAVLAGTAIRWTAAPFDQVFGKRRQGAAAAMAALAAKLPPAPGKMVEQMLRGEEPERRWTCVGHGTQSGPRGGDGAPERMEGVGGKHIFGGWQIGRVTV